MLSSLPTVGLLPLFPQLWLIKRIGAFWLSLGATLTPYYNATGAYYNSSESGKALALGKAEYYDTYGMSSLGITLHGSMFADLTDHFRLLLHDHDRAYILLRLCISQDEHHSRDYLPIH